MGAEPHARTRLDSLVLRGFVWTSGGRLLVQLATWVVSITVARLLADRDYGIAAMASLYVGFAQTLAEFGIGAAIVQRKDLPPHLVGTLTGVSVLLAVVLSLVSIPAAYGLSRFYDEPILIPIVLVYGLNFIPLAFRSVSTSLLTRDMAFGRITLLGLIETGGASITSLVLALAGWSVWALVLGNTVAIWVAAIVSASWAHPGFNLRLGELRGSGILTFGGKVLVSRVAWYFFASTDFLIIGRRIGAGALGHYSLAYQLASIPAERITGALTQVLFPVFSQLQHDRAELGRYFRNATEACTLVLMPAYVGLALVAPDLVEVALGAKWREAVPILVFLSLTAVFRSVTSVTNTVIVSAGNAGFPARLSLIGLAVFPPAFYVASYWGAAAVAAVWMVLHPPVLGIPALVVALRVSSMRARDLLTTLTPALWGTALMALAVFATQWLSSGFSPLPRLVLTVIAGAATYAAVLLLCFRDRVQRYVGLASRGFAAGGGPAAAPPPAPTAPVPGRTL